MLKSDFFSKNNNNNKKNNPKKECKFLTVSCNRKKQTLKLLLKFSSVDFVNCIILLYHHNVFDLFFQLMVFKYIANKNS